MADVDRAPHREFGNDIETLSIYDNLVVVSNRETVLRNASRDEITPNNVLSVHRSYFEMFTGPELLLDYVDDGTRYQARVVLTAPGEIDLAHDAIDAALGLERVTQLDGKIFSVPSEDRGTAVDGTTVEPVPEMPEEVEPLEACGPDYDTVGLPPASARLPRRRASKTQRGETVEATSLVIEDQTDLVQTTGLQPNHRQTYPVILIPGTAASFLKRSPWGTPPEQTDDGAYVDRKTDWTSWLDLTVLAGLPGWDSWWMNCLALEKDGSTDPRHQGIYPAAAFANPWDPLLDFYSGLINRLRDVGFEVGRWLRLFPYDWRLAPTFNAKRLDSLVNATLSETRASKVILLSHSQGGLVARTYIWQQRGAKVRASISLAAPWLGLVLSFQALNILGWNFDAPFANALTARDLVQNWPAVYAMLPDYRYVKKTDKGFFRYIDRYGTADWHTPAQQVEWIHRHHNGPLYDQTVKWRSDILDGSDHNVEQVSVISDIPSKTLTHYTLIRGGDQGGVKSFVDERTMGPGDGTVPILSASLRDANAPLGNMHVQPFSGPGTPEHPNMAQDGHVQNYVLDRLDAMQRA